MCLALLGAKDRKQTSLISGSFHFEERTLTNVVSDSGESKE